VLLAGLGRAFEVGLERLGVVEVVTGFSVPVLSEVVDADVSDCLEMVVVSGAEAEIETEVSEELGGVAELGAGLDAWAACCVLTGLRMHLLTCRLRLDATPKRRPHVSHWKAIENLLAPFVAAKWRKLAFFSCMNEKMLNQREKSFHSRCLPIYKKVIVPCEGCSGGQIC